VRDILKLAAKHTIIFSIGDVAQKAISFILLPVFMRCLSPEDYGILSMLGILSMAFNGLVMQGMPTAAFRAYSYDYSKNESERKDAIYTAYSYLLLSSLITYSALFVTASFWSHLLFKQGDFTGFVRLVFVTEFLNCSNIIPLVMLRARLMTTWFALISLARVFLTMFLSIWFVVYLDMKIYGVLLANLIVAGIVFLFVPIIPILIHKGFSLHISLDKLKGMLAFGWPIVPGIFAAWILSATDRYFLEHFSTRTELGLYSVGFKLASILTIVFIEPFRKAWPAIFFPKAQEGDAPQVFSQFATYFLFVGAAGSLAVICSTDHLIKIMGPKEYWDAYMVVPLLVIGLLLHGFQASINLGMFIKNKMKYAPIIVIVAAVSNIVFCAILVPPYGMMGASVATMLAYIIQLVMSFMINQRIYPIPFEYRRMAHMTGIFILVVILNYLIRIDSLWWSLPVKAGLFVLFFGLLLITGFFTRREIDFIREVRLKVSSVIAPSTLRER